MSVIVCDADFLIKITNDPLPRLDPDVLLVQNSLMTIPSVIRELIGLTKRKGMLARRARNTLNVIQAKSKEGKFKIAETGAGASREQDADLALVEFARESHEKTYIATLDGSLLSRLERLEIPYLTLSNNRPIFRSYET